MIRRKTLNAYNASRPKEARHAICHAPFSSLNFEQMETLLPAVLIEFMSWEISRRIALKKPGQVQRLRR